MQPATNFLERSQTVQRMLTTDRWTEETAGCLLYLKLQQTQPIFQSAGGDKPATPGWLLPTGQELAKPPRAERIEANDDQVPRAT